MARLLVCLVALSLLAAPTFAGYVENWNSIPLGADGWMTGAWSGPQPLNPIVPPGNFTFTGDPAVWSPVGGLKGGCVYSSLADLRAVDVNGYAALLGMTSHSVDFTANPTVSVSMLDPVLDEPVNCGPIHFGVTGADGGVFMTSAVLPMPTASWTTSSMTLGASALSWITVVPGNLAAALQNPTGWGFAAESSLPLMGVIVFDNVQVTPEPMTLSLLAAGGLLLMRRRRA